MKPPGGRKGVKLKQIIQYNRRGIRLKLLDSMAEAGVSRMKVETSEAVEGGISQKAYHHGRCDVGSPFATGKLFDLEDTADP